MTSRDGERRWGDELTGNGCLESKGQMLIEKCRERRGRLWKQDAVTKGSSGIIAHDAATLKCKGRRTNQPRCGPRRDSTGAPHECTEMKLLTGLGVLFSGDQVGRIRNTNDSLPSGATYYRFSYCNRSC